MHCAHTQAGPGLGWARLGGSDDGTGSGGTCSGLRRRGGQRRHWQWPEAAAPARAVGAQARSSGYCARLVAVQCYSRARAAMGARARARARRLVT